MNANDWKTYKEPHSGSRVHIVNPAGGYICGKGNTQHKQSNSFDVPKITQLCATCYRRLLEHGLPEDKIPLTIAGYLPLLDAMTYRLDTEIGTNVVHVGEFIQVNDNKYLFGVVGSVAHGHVMARKRVYWDFYTPTIINLSELICDEVSWFAFK